MLCQLVLLGPSGTSPVALLMIRHRVAYIILICYLFISFYIITTNEINLKLKLGYGTVSVKNCVLYGVLLLIMQASYVPTYYAAPYISQRFACDDGISYVSENRRSLPS